MLMNCVRFGRIKPLGPAHEHNFSNNPWNNFSFPLYGPMYRRYATGISGRYLTSTFTSFVFILYLHNWVPFTGSIVNEIKVSSFPKLLLASLILLSVLRFLLFIVPLSALYSLALIPKFSLNTLANAAEPEKPQSKAISVIDLVGFPISIPAAFSALRRWIN